MKMHLLEIQSPGHKGRDFHLQTRIVTLLLVVSLNQDEG